ncbi:putative ABC exporter domain-containing protein [Tundrisphaera lichenicola]|uniref:putative ABC exporter domain-containing protein n=1 Tax=Tundrisphaera lichenicola TaxID=2029860 RepID=UPI003EBF06F1
MDRSLLLLMHLRNRAALRRLKKTLSTPKGIAMGAITAALFIPWLMSIVVTAQAGVRAPVEYVQRFGPLCLFVFTVGSLLFSGGEQALYYTPAEIAFLFAGPYRKRELLAYKLVLTGFLSVFSALFFTLASMSISPRLFSAFVGSILTIFFLQVLQMAVGLGVSTLGALASSWGRRLVLVALIILIGLAALSAGHDLGSGGMFEALARIERSPIIFALLSPFRWFILAFTAERIWPDLVRYAALGLVVDVALVALVFALDASYLEAVSSSSARRFAKMQKMGGGGGGIRSMNTRKSGRFRFRPPAVPWWGGVGPNFWRQMTTALGDPGRLITVLGMLSTVPLIMIFFVPRDGPKAEPIPYVCMGMIAWMSIILSFLLPYDFRGDIDIMEELKTLPIAPNSMALGQVLTPTLVATCSQALAMAVVMVGFKELSMATWAVLLFLFPVNLIFYSVENLLFLWYPSRVVAGQFDVMAVGRQMIFLLAKVVGLAVSVGLAGLAGFLAFLITGRSLTASLGVAWVVLSASALGLIPLVGLAFSRFDVSRDVPA